MVGTWHDRIGLLNLLDPRPSRAQGLAGLRDSFRGTMIRRGGPSGKVRPGESTGGERRNLHRHIRLALRSLERPVLSIGLPQGGLPRVLRYLLLHHRDQQLLLPVAGEENAPSVVERGS